MTKFRLLVFGLSFFVINSSFSAVTMTETRCAHNGKQRRCLSLQDSTTKKQYFVLPYKNNNLEYNKLKSEVNFLLSRGEAFITSVFPNNAKTLKMGEASLTFTFIKGGSAQLDQSTMDLRYLTRKLKDCESRRGALRAVGDALGVTEDNCSRGNIVDSNRGSIDPKSSFRFENYGKELPTRYGSQPTVRSQ